MKQRSKRYIYLISCLCVILSIECLYMYKQNDKEEFKKAFVKLSTLPDLALSNEAHFIRHRSYADTFSVFANSPELLEYFPSTFVYAPSSLKNSSRFQSE